MFKFDITLELTNLILKTHKNDLEIDLGLGYGLFAISIVQSKLDFNKSRTVLLVLLLNPQVHSHHSYSQISLLAESQ